jgi:hypothetical protein
MPFYVVLGAAVVVAAVVLGWFASREGHAAAWPHTNFKKIGLTSFEIVVALMLSPFLVVAFVLFVVPLLALSPLFLTDEYEEDGPHAPIANRLAPAAAI